MAYWIVGSEAVMRESSSTLPSLIGTLKSTRMNRRWPGRIRSFIDSLATKSTKRKLKTFGSDVFNEIPNAARVAPLVVVPRKHFQHRPADDFRVFSIDDRRVRIALEVDRYERLFREVENAA